MATPQYTDEVLVTLSSIDPPETFPFPDRRVFLSRECSVISLGRTSKRNVSLEASQNNGWLDSAVMSRGHAELKFDADRRIVYLEDTGSLHGTFLNDDRLVRGNAFILNNGDVVKFGIPIDRGPEKFQPCVMEVRLQFGDLCPQDRPKVFRVPDDSDSGEDESILHGSEIIQQAQIRIPAAQETLPHVAAYRQTATSEGCIDLTLTSMDETDDHHEAFGISTEAADEDTESTDDIQEKSDSDNCLKRNGSVKMYFSDSENETDDYQMDESDFGEHDDFEEDTASVQDDDEQNLATAPQNVDYNSSIIGQPFFIPRSYLAENMGDFEPQDSSPVVPPANFTPPAQATDSHSSQLQYVQDRCTKSSSIFPQVLRDGSAPESIPAPIGKSADVTPAPEPSADTPTQTQAEQAFTNMMDHSSHAHCSNTIERLPAPHQHALPPRPSWVPFSTSSAWAFSGEKFLNSPAFAGDVYSHPNTNVTPSALDETSAYQFELSKKAAEVMAEKQPATANNQGKLGIRYIVNAPIKSQTSATDETNRPKRKAAEISELTPEEHVSEITSGLEAAPVAPEESLKENVEFQTTNEVSYTQVPLVPHEVGRSPKRMRRVAEAVGYVALGGVAVMSALIATAPTL